MFNWQYSSIGSGNGLSPARRQAIIWSNDDIGWWRIFASLGLNELKLANRSFGDNVKEQYREYNNVLPLWCFVAVAYNPNLSTTCRNTSQDCSSTSESSLMNTADLLIGSHIDTQWNPNKYAHGNIVHICWINLMWSCSNTSLLWMLC